MVTSFPPHRGRQQAFGFCLTSDQLKRRFYQPAWPTPSLVTPPRPASPAP
ncbi:MAG: hypothetical protein U0401_06060 [Anaerolineae bacterium]